MLPSASRMFTAPLLAGMLGGLPVAVGLPPRLRGLLVLMPASHFLGLLRWPVRRPLLSSTIALLRLGPRLPLLMVRRTLLPFPGLLAPILLPLWTILLMPILIAPGIRRNRDPEKQSEDCRAGDSKSLHGDRPRLRTFCWNDEIERRC
jgi:hypothetical protein